MIFNDTYKNSGVLSSSVESEVAGLQELFIKITVGHILANHCAQHEKLWKKENTCYFTCHNISIFSILRQIRLVKYSVSETEDK